jgi:hypothetical protein
MNHGCNDFREHECGPELDGTARHGLVAAAFCGLRNAMLPQWFGRPALRPRAWQLAHFRIAEIRLNRALSRCTLLPLWVPPNLREKLCTDAHDSAGPRRLVGEASLAVANVRLGKSSLLGVHGGNFEPYLNSKNCKQVWLVCSTMSGLEQALRLRCRTAQGFKSLIA